MGGHEAFSPVEIDAQLKGVGWTLTRGRSARFEHRPGDGRKPDYVLYGRLGLDA